MADVQIGALVAGRYRIQRKIGEGGMGSVWLVKNEVTERDFAIKFLHPSDERSKAQLDRFFQEAKVAGRLRHPSVVEIFDAGTEPGLGNAPYLVMELLDGIGLDHAILRAGALPLGTSLEIMSEVCRALALAHDKGIIHRDLKPSNVFLHRIGSGALVPKVLDFGISKVLIDDSTGRHVTGMTRTGAVLGSPLYMSPEQAAGDKSIDARSDVHSLGVMLWECLTGHAPFRAETYGLLLVEIIQGDRPHIRQVLPSVPESVAAVLDRAIARDRAQRHANAGELAEAIDREITMLGHVPGLAARTGADAFFATLGGAAPAAAEVATSTTAAVEVPSVDGAGRGAAAARSAQAEPAVPAAVPAPARRPLPEPTLSSVPKKSLAVPILLSVLGVAAVGALAVVIATRNGAQGPAPSAELGAPAVTTAAAASSSSPLVAPMLSARAPDPSASSAPEPSASTARPVAAKTRPVEQTKPLDQTKPTAKPKPSASPVHHGVTSSGL